MKVLMISFDRHLFLPTSDVAARMRALGERLDELHIIVLSLRRHGCEATQLSERVHLHPTNASYKLGYLTRGLQLARRLRTSADIIVSQDPFDTGLIGYMYSRLTGLPLYVQEHGDLYSTEHWRKESWLNLIRYYIGLFVLRRAACVRVVSERSKRTLIARGVQEERIKSFPVRTPVGALRDAKPQFDLHEKYPDASTIILTLARLVPQKNLFLLIDAFAFVLEKHPNALLLIVGEGPQKEALALSAGERGVIAQVVFEPWTNDLASYYKTADIYALSSNYEGWGRVLVEAMACGLPAVTIDVGLVGEVFKDGQHGRVVPVGDTRAFAEALLELIERPALRQEMGARGRRDTRQENDEASYHNAFVESLHQCGARRIE